METSIKCYLFKILNFCFCSAYRSLFKKRRHTRHLPPVCFEPKHIRITLFTKILLSNSKILLKTLINVRKLNVYLFLGIPGARAGILGHSY